MTTLESIGKNLRTARILAGYTQQEAAILADLTRSDLSRIESGKRPHISIPLLERVAKALHTNLKELIL